MRRQLPHEYSTVTRRWSIGSATTVTLTAVLLDHLQSAHPQLEGVLCDVDEHSEFSYKSNALWEEEEKLIVQSYLYTGIPSVLISFAAYFPMRKQTKIRG